MLRLNRNVIYGKLAKNYGFAHLREENFKNYYEKKMNNKR